MTLTGASMSALATFAQVSFADQQAAVLDFLTNLWVAGKVFGYTMGAGIYGADRYALQMSRWVPRALLGDVKSITPEAYEDISKNFDALVGLINEVKPYAGEFIDNAVVQIRTIANNINPLRLRGSDKKWFEGIKNDVSGALIGSALLITGAAVAVYFSLKK